MFDTDFHLYGQDEIQPTEALYSQERTTSKEGQDTGLGRWINNPTVDAFFVNTTLTFGC